MVWPCCACAFWLRQVLCAATACHFSSLIWPAGSAPAALASHKTLEKHSVSRLSYLFAHLDLLSSFSSFTVFFLFFSSLTFSSDFLLCFSSVHMVGSLTSKLPSFDDMIWDEMIRFDVGLGQFVWSTTLASYNFNFLILSLGHPAATLPISPCKHQSKPSILHYLAAHLLIIVPQQHLERFLAGSCEVFVWGFSEL